MTSEVLVRPFVSVSEMLPTRTFDWIFRGNKTVGRWLDCAPLGGFITTHSAAASVQMNPSPSEIDHNGKKEQTTQEYVHVNTNKNKVIQK
jgi:hypothetical protein